MSGKAKCINTSNSVLVCAFCKYWYDPCRTHIRPDERDPFRAWWKYDQDVKSYCEARKRQTFSQSVCTRFSKRDL